MPRAHKFCTKAPKICGQSVRNLLLVTPALCPINYAYYPGVPPTTQAGPESNFDRRHQRLVLRLHVSAWCYACTSALGATPARQRVVLRLHVSAWCYACTSARGATSARQRVVLHLHVKQCVSVGQRNVPEILYNDLRNVYSI